MLCCHGFILIPYGGSQESPGKHFTNLLEITDTTFLSETINEQICSTNKNEAGSGHLLL